MGGQGSGVRGHRTSANEAQQILGAHFPTSILSHIARIEKSPVEVGAIFHLQSGAKLVEQSGTGSSTGSYDYTLEDAQKAGVSPLAKDMIDIHNHPGDNPMPSEQDIVSWRVRGIGKAMVVSSEGHTLLLEAARWPQDTTQYKQVVADAFSSGYKKFGPGGVDYQVFKEGFEKLSVGGKVTLVK